MKRTTPCCQFVVIERKKREEKEKRKKREEKKKRKREEGRRVWWWGEPLLRMCAGRANEKTTTGRRWADGSRESARPRISRAAGRREGASPGAWREEEREIERGQRKEGLGLVGKVKGLPWFLFDLYSVENYQEKSDVRVY